MKVNDLFLNINSPDPERLFAFYRDTVGLDVRPEAGEWSLAAGPGATIGIDGHSEINGRAKDPARMLVNLFVDDCAAAEAELKARGVSFFRSQGVEWWGGVISSFEDPDGNYVQVIQYDPSRATQPAGAATA